MKKIITAMLLLVMISLSHSGVLSAQDPDISGTTLLLNFLVPGVAQIEQGKDEGWWYTPGTALYIGGAFLTGQNYVPTSPDAPWNAAAGILMMKTGEMLTMYSTYAYLNDTGHIWKNYTRASLPELLISPFLPENFFTADILPVVGIGALTSIPLLFEGDRPGAIASFFMQDTVSFWGAHLNPWTAYSCYLGYTLLLCSINAVSEETACRGIVSGPTDQWLSASIFGGMHASNIMLMDLSEENIRDTALQVVGAFCLGLYFDNLVRESGGDLQKAVSLHHWWNFCAMALGFLTEISDPSPEIPVTADKTSDLASVRMGAFLDSGCRPGLAFSIMW
jgi:hypothetical protein